MSVMRVGWWNYDLYLQRKNDTNYPKELLPENPFQEYDDLFAHLTLQKLKYHVLEYMPSVEAFGEAANTKHHAQ